MKSTIQPHAASPCHHRKIYRTLDIARIQVELERHLGVSVDVLTPKALPDQFRDQVLREARSI